MFPFNQNKVLIIAGVVTVMAITAIVVANRHDPMAEMMVILENQSNLCIQEISDTGAGQSRCEDMRTIAHEIFGDDPVQWGKDMVLSENITSRNFAVVKHSLLTYQNALMLLIKQKTALIKS